MELTMNMSPFKVLDEKELYLLDGGSKEAAAGIMIIGGAVIAGILAPLTCGGSLAVYAGGALTGYGCMAAGVVVAAGG